MVVQVKFPRRLNYIVLKKLDDVRNHSTKKQSSINYSGIFTLFGIILNILRIYSTLPMLLGLKIPILKEYCQIYQAST